MMSAYLRLVPIAAFILMASAATFASPAGDEDAPVGDKPTKAAQINISPAEFDFGEVWEGQEVKREFTVRNTGTDTLHVRLRTTCGCTLTSSKSLKIEPGQQDTFEVEFDTSHTGMARKAVVLATSDPKNETMRISVHGHVKKLIELSKPTLNFRGLTVDSRETQTLELVSQHDKPLNLKIATEQDTDCFDVRLKEIEKGKVWTLSATTRPPLDPHHHVVRLKLDTGFKAAPSYVVRIIGYVQPAVMVVPSRLVVLPNHKAGTRRSLNIRYRLDRPIRVARVRTVPEGIACEVFEPTKDAGGTHGRIQIEVTLPDPKTLDNNSRIEIYTDDPQFGRLVVPINARVPRAPGSAGPPGPGGS